MRLSEAIRLGATMKPQGFGFFLKDGATCAQGAALDAVGRLNVEMPLSCHYAFAELWAWAGHSAFGGERLGRYSCPAQPCEALRDSMAGMICHLNNEHEWNREHIADFVELHESIPVPESVEEEQHV